eukprot:scaffold14154_cov114-Skeletonema_dohrnii-CCMP3373.AAC.5
MNMNMDMMVTEVEGRQQLRPDGSSDGDDNLAIAREAKTTLTSVSTGSIPTAAATADSHLPTLQDRPDPPEDDLPDDIITAPPPLDEDCVKLCEEGCSLPTPTLDDEDNDSNSDDELQSLCRQPSIITKTPSESDDPCLPEDTFSFLIYSRVRSRAFCLATFVLLFQITIYGVLAVEILDVRNGRNPLLLPVNVHPSVRAAEFLSTVVAIIIQDDARKAVTLLRDGFDQDLPKAFEGTTKAKWILSILLRAFVGMFGLFLTFLLIMQSTDVINLLLNFLAMEFVSQLDDLVFVLTREGFFGRRLQKEAKKLSNTFYRVSHLSADSRTASIVTKVYFIFLFTVMFAAWGYIVWNQKNGKYMCPQIFAQFGDEVAPMLGTFSGFFFLRNQRDYLIEHRWKQYVEGYRLSYTDEQGRVLLSYCNREKRWTLSLTDGYYRNPCVWIAASDQTIDDFDVVKTVNSQWVVRTPTKHKVGNIVPLSQHFLTCFECIGEIFDYDFDMCEYGACTQLAGKYKGHECKCNPGYYGLFCDNKPCQTLEIESEGFMKTGGPNPSYFDSKYGLIGAHTYAYPVYTSLGDNQTLSDDTDFILFTGARWILSYKSLFPELKDVNDVDGLVRYFSTKFHGLFSNYSTLYVSEPVTFAFGSAVDGMKSPIGMGWLHSSASASASDEVFDQQLHPDLQKGVIETSFFCAVCNKWTNPCLVGALCQSNGTCDCPEGYFGSMCQTPPEFTGNLTISNGA